MRVEAMDYDSITGRLALFAAGMVSAAGSRRAAGPAEGSRDGDDIARQEAGQPRHGAWMAESSHRPFGVGVAQFKAGDMDAGTSRHNGEGIERLSAVKRQDMLVLFAITLLFWAAYFGGEVVLKFMRGE